MLQTLDRYLLRETVKAAIAIMTVLVLVLASHIFIRFLESVAAGELSPGVLFQVLGFEILKQIPRLVPPAFFFSILFTLGRMYRDSEMIALASCGVGPGHIYRAYLITALLVAGVEAWLSMFAMPWSTRAVEEIKHAQRQSVDVAGIEAGQFNQFGRSDLVFFVEKISEDDQRMHQIFVQNRNKDTIELITAHQGFQHFDLETGDRYLVLQDGYRYEGTIGRGDYTVGQFKQYAVRISQSAEKMQRLRHRAIPTSQLLTSEKMVDRAEFQFRLTLPLAVMAFTILSIPLSRSLPREGMFGRLLLAFGLYFIFINLQDVAENWMEHEITPQWIGMWWVPVLMVLIGLSFNLQDLSWIRNRKRRCVSSRVI